MANNTILKRSIVYILIILVGHTYLLISQENTDLEKICKEYPGVTFTIPKKVIKDYDLYQKEYPLDISNMPRFESILDGLEAIFLRMVDIYNIYKIPPEGYKGSDNLDAWEKKPLPSCLRETLDKFFSDLKNNRKQLKIIWYKGNNPEWGILIH